jgi:hypothetical protein
MAGRKKLQRSIGSGVPSTRTASFSTFSSRAGATRRPPNACFASSSIRKLLKKQGRAPRVLVTDKLKSYAAAKREIMPGVGHRQHKGLNNRAENSHQPAPAVQVAAAGSTLPFRP